MDVRANCDELAVEFKQDATSIQFLGGTITCGTIVGSFIPETIVFNHFELMVDGKPAGVIKGDEIHYMTEQDTFRWSTRIRRVGQRKIAFENLLKSPDGAELVSGTLTLQ